MSARKRFTGLTLVELLIVIAIIALLLFPLLVTYRTSRANQALRSSTEHLADDLRTAHIYARESKDKKAWGIKRVDSDTYALVSRKDATENVEVNFHLDSGITFLTDFTLWFGQGTGEIDTDAEIRLQNENGKLMKITIIKSGAVEVISIQP